MARLSNVQPQDRVLGSDGALVGIVEAVEGGERIRLGSEGNGATRPSYIPSFWVAQIDEGVVRLDRDAATARGGLNDDILAGDGTS